MDYDTIWSGERGSYLCAGGPSLSPRLAMETVAEPSDRSRTGPGYRPVGGRFRDRVYEHVCLSPIPMTVATICVNFDSTGPLDMVLISRALATLVREGRLARELVKLGPGRRRWVYWRP